MQGFTEGLVMWMENTVNMKKLTDYFSRKAEKARKGLQPDISM